MESPWPSRDDWTRDKVFPCWRGLREIWEIVHVRIDGQERFAQTTKPFYTHLPLYFQQQKVFALEWDLNKLFQGNSTVYKNLPMVLIILKKPCKLVIINAVDSMDPKDRELFHWKNCNDHLVLKNAFLEDTNLAD